MVTILFRDGKGMKLFLLHKILVKNFLVKFSNVIGTKVITGSVVI